MKWLDKHWYTIDTVLMWIVCIAILIGLLMCVWYFMLMLNLAEAAISEGFGEPQRICTSVEMFLNLCPWQNK